MADQAARAAVTMNYVDNCSGGVNQTDPKIYYKEEFMIEWQTDWDKSNAKLRTIKKMVEKRRRKHLLSRTKDVSLTRLRIGHTNLTSLYMLRGLHQPRCHECNQVLTVHHLLLECEKYRAVRNELNMSDTIETVLMEKPEHEEKVIKFLERTHLMGKI